MTHINPGTDTTINPVVIDDSYREMRQPQPRKEVARFAEAMEAVLRKHDDKGGWENCGLAWLIDRAQEELNEAKEKWDAKNFKGDYDAVATELIDVANFCMMFYDNVQNDGYHHDHPYPNTSAPSQPTLYKTQTDDDGAIGKVAICLCEQCIAAVIGELEAMEEKSTSNDIVSAGYRTGLRKAIALLQAGDSK